MLTIAAKQLSQLAMPNACPRCFWIQKYAGNKLPYQRFPGVFAHLDRAAKKATATAIASGLGPQWLKWLVELRATIPAPHWSKFKFEHGDLQVRGEADLIAEMDSGGLFIGDFKTAMVTAKQDELLPAYAAQLNCYAMAAEAQGIGTVKQLGLIYCEPAADSVTASCYGYTVPFACSVVPIERDDDKVGDLCDQAHYILSNPLPAPTHGCDDCDKLAGLQSILITGVVP